MTYMASETNLILEELKDIKKDLSSIKKYIIDEDRKLTEDNIRSIKEDEKDLEEGRTKRLI